MGTTKPRRNNNNTIYTPMIPSFLEQTLINDPTGDTLDALLACVQAAWASRQDSFGIPVEVDALEGWIVDPSLR